MVRRGQTVAFALASSAHVIFWFAQVRGDSAGAWRCGELSCLVLLVADAPVSFLYFISNETVTWGSLILGTAWWGVLGVGLVNVVALSAVAVSKSMFVEFQRRTARQKAWLFSTAAAVPLYGYQLYRLLGFDG